VNEARRYLETQVLTAPREQLLLMLLDGAIRFATQARDFAAAGDFDRACPLNLRAQAIALELVSALDRSLDAQIFRNLTGLYLFVYRRLVAANIDRQTGPADEALSILGKLRAMWGEAIARMKSDARSLGEGAAKIIAESEVTLQG